MADYDICEKKMREKDFVGIVTFDLGKVHLIWQGGRGEDIETWSLKF